MNRVILIEADLRLRVELSDGGHERKMHRATLGDVVISYTTAEKAVITVPEDWGKDEFTEVAVWSKTMYGPMSLMYYGRVTFFEPAEDGCLKILSDEPIDITVAHQQAGTILK